VRQIKLAICYLLGASKSTSLKLKLKLKVQYRHQIKNTIPIKSKPY